MESCPFCGEPLLGTAATCRACGQTLPGVLSLPPPPPDWKEEVLARIHVTAEDGWPENPAPRNAAEKPLAGPLGTLFLTNQRLVYLPLLVTERRPDPYDIDVWISRGQGVSVPLSAIVETRCFLTGDPWAFTGEATLAVRTVGGDGASAHTFTASDFAPQWAGFVEWESAIKAVRAGKVVDPL